MSDLFEGYRGLRTSAILVVAGAVLSGPVAMIVVAHTAPQPPWTGVSTFAESYSQVQALPYALGYLLIGGFVLFAASCHALAGAGLRTRTSAGLVFAGIYAALVFTNYTLQLGYIPRVLNSRPEFIAGLTMANPSSFAWFLEMFGYAAMGVATWLVAPGFGGSARADLIRYLLVANGLVSVIGAACTAIIDRWVFSTAGLISFGAWNILIAVCYSLIAVSPHGGFALAVGSSANDA